MAKLNSLQGKAIGKVGSVVYSINGGQMIAREYQPKVANPNTVAQTAQRAKFKLLSQLAAALAPVIVIPRKGLVSSRNGFVKRNSDMVSAVEGIAQVTYENLQLTNGNAGLPAIEASRSVESGISVHLTEKCDAAVSRVVYIAYKKNAEQTLQFVQSIVVEAPGAEGNFPGTLDFVEGDVCLFAYGMTDLSAKAAAKYANYNVANAQDIARLVYDRSISTSDYQFTRTRGTTIFTGEDSTTVVPEGSARVYLTPEGPGTVQGAGVYEIGSEVTIIATPNAGATFRGWRVNGGNTIISTSAEYTFTVNGLTDLVAVFASQGQQTEYTLSISSSNTSLGTVSPNGVYEVNAGDSVTLVATPASQMDFDGWFVDGSTVALSTQRSYTFTPNRDMVIVGRFSNGYEG